MFDEICNQLRLCYQLKIRSNLPMRLDALKSTVAMYALNGSMSCSSEGLFRIIHAKNKVSFGI